MDLFTNIKLFPSDIIDGLDSYTVKKKKKTIHKIYSKKIGSLGCQNFTVKQYGSNILGFTVLT